MSDLPTPDFPEPDLSGPNRAYWEALAEGRLSVQSCKACGKAQLPAREACRHCLATELEMVAASGEAELVSWIINHRSYHPAFAEALPYNVAIVRLKEGPQLTTNVLTDDFAALKIGAPLRFTRAQRFGRGIALFELMKDPE